MFPLLGAALLCTAALGAEAKPLTTVHIIAHSHNDPGWLESESEYFQERTKKIITNVVQSLEADPHRVFQWVEMVYFREWWGEQTPDKQASVRSLVKSRQLVFLTGGLCMHDEAIAHQGAVIDQMTWGHRFINQTFGLSALPDVGWQIDAFGHSAGSAALMAAMNIKAVIGQKIDFQEHAHRAQEQELEFLWKADRTNQPNTSVFGHLMFDNTDGYSFVLPQKDEKAEGPNDFGVTIPLRTSNCTGGPPGGNGCCKAQCGSNCDSCAVELILNGGTPSDPHRLGHGSVARAAHTIAARVATMVSEYKKGAEHVLFAFGSDFQFQDAPAPFLALEVCMEFVKANREKYGFELIYSTPATYFAAIGAPGFGSATTTAETTDAASDWPVLDGGDFLPAAFSAHYIRSGFFTSRPASKASDRVAWMDTHAAKSLEVLASVASAGSSSSSLTQQLARAIAAADAAVGVHQHHDGLTGTDLAFVALNYANMIANATALVASAAASAAATLVGLPTAGASGCTESNISVCSATAPLERNTPVSLVLYNPLGSSRTEVVAVPVPVATVEVVDSDGVAVPHEVHPSIMSADAADGGQPWTLFIKAVLKPLELVRLTLHPTLEGQGKPPVAPELATGGGTISLSVETGATVAVDAQTGMLVSMADQKLNCSLQYYTPAVGSNKSHGWGKTDDCSTAYAFRPMPGVPKKMYGPAVSAPKVYRGSLVQQTHVVVDEAAGIELAVRVTAGDSSVHLISQLGPLDISNGFGQEAVIELSSSSIDSGAEWRTDSNGLFMMQRTRRTNHSGFFPGYVVAEPEAQNYMPATCMAELRASSAVAKDGPSLAVAFTSSHGVTSLAPGTLELMMHRRFVDHGCRVDKGYQMNDTYRIVKSLRVQALPSSAGLTVANRLGARDMHHPVSAYFVPVTATATDIDTAGDGAAVAQLQLPPELPQNVHLHTLRTSLGSDLRCSPFPPRQCDKAPAAHNGTLELLVRLQHLFSSDDDPSGLSKPVSVELVAWLAVWGRVLRVDETTLSAAAVIGADLHGPITLSPMQIRTFIVTLRLTDGPVS
jgi:hypothetical protein